MPHVQDPDRLAGAAVAVHQHGAECLILDDGFQHRRLRRDLDVVLIDATAPFGPGSLRRPGCRGFALPAGLLREVPAGLERAGLILLTRCDAVTDDERAAVETALADLAPDVPVVPVNFPPTALVGLGGETRPAGWANGRRVGAFCGIGNPAAFRATVEGLGATAATFEPLPDHRVPGAERRSRALCERAAAAGAVCGAVYGEGLGEAADGGVRRVRPAAADPGGADGGGLPAGDGRVAGGTVGGGRPRRGGASSAADRGLTRAA